MDSQEPEPSPLLAFIEEQERLLAEKAQAQAQRLIEDDHQRRLQDQPADPAEAKRQQLLKMHMEKLGRLQQQCLEASMKAQLRASLLEDPQVYNAHARLLLSVAENALAHQRRRFAVDDANRAVLRFLLYYFNDCPLCESVFPDRGYKMHKHILLQGAVGSGKTLLMEVFSEYLRLTESPNFFHNLSVTQMVNYYTLHNNLDRYTFNEESGQGFKAQPVNICLNDIGVQTTTFFGMDTNLLTNEFLHARNEIWASHHRYAHLTTNLTNAQLRERYSDAFGRLVDRFKTYNVLPLPGSSRR